MARHTVCTYRTRWQWGKRKELYKINNNTVLRTESWNLCWRRCRWRSSIMYYWQRQWRDMEEEGCGTQHWCWRRCWRWRRWGEQKWRRIKMSDNDDNSDDKDVSGSNNSNINTIIISHLTEYLQGWLSIMITMGDGDEDSNWWQRMAMWDNDDNDDDEDVSANNNSNINTIIISYLK